MGLDDSVISVLLRLMRVLRRAMLLHHEERQGTRTGKRQRRSGTRGSDAGAVFRPFECGSAERCNAVLERGRRTVSDAPPPVVLCNPRYLCCCNELRLVGVIVFDGT